MKICSDTIYKDAIIQVFKKHFMQFAFNLGHPKTQDRFCPLRQVSSLNQKDIVLEKVSCSDAAVVCLTSQGDIYVLHEYQCRKIASK